MKKIYKKEWIKRFINVHGNKYIYNKSNFIDSHTDICIICPEHGEFWMTPSNHCCGQGCPECAKISFFEKRRKSLDTVLNEFREVHGDKYDYSKFIYKGTDLKSCIICHELDGEGHEHGEFWQTPYRHKKGGGCPKCAGNLKMTLDVFLKRAHKVHSDKYDYSKVEYEGIGNKVCIICPVHGEFWMTPNAHLHGSGCPKCVGKYKTTEDFIRESVAKHGDKYDYSKSVYLGAFNKTIFICHQKNKYGEEHGEFIMTPHDHLCGNGCPKCRRQKQSERQRKTLNKFQEDLDRLYGNGYISLEKAEYINAHTPLTIIIKDIGERRVTPNKLMSGVGCKVFKESYLEHDVKLFLEENNIKYEQEKKFTWLKYKSLLRLDFYLPEYNIAIECQGAQHFIPLKSYHSTYTYEEQIEKDILKFNLCNEHEIPILYYTNKENLKFEDISDIYQNKLFSELNVLKDKILNVK